MNKLFILAMAVMALASCKNRNVDNNTENSADGNSTDTVTYTIDYIGGLKEADNLLFYDMKVSYRDAGGNLVEETVTEYPFTKQIAGAEAPFTAEITPTYTLKAIEDIASDKDRFTICDLGFYINYKSSDGQTSGQGIHVSSMTLPLENAYKYVQSQIDKNNGKTFKVELK